MNAYAQAMLDAAYAAYRKRHYAEAWTTLRFVAGSGWRDPLTLRFMAQLEDLRDDTESAADWLATAVSIDPTNATAHSHLADALAKLGRLEDAIPEYQRAIDLDASLSEAYGGLTATLHLLHRDAEALDLAEVAVSHATDQPHAHRMLGTALTWLNRHEAALEHFGIAQACNPDDATTRNHEGMALLALGQLRAGWPLYETRMEPTAVEIDIPRNAATDVAWRRRHSRQHYPAARRTRCGRRNPIRPICAACGSARWHRVAGSSSRPEAATHVSSRHCWRDCEW